MNVLALDQSSMITGYAIFIDGVPKKISHFSAGSSSTKIGKRLKKICDTITELIQEYNINQVAFEDIQLQTSAGNNVRTFKILAQVQGAIIKLLTELNIPYEIIPPITWKATFKFAGKGRAAEKAAAQSWVAEHYGIQCSEDEADAACLGTHFVGLPPEKPVFDWS